MSTISYMNELTHDDIEAELVRAIESLQQYPYTQSIEVCSETSLIAHVDSLADAIAKTNIITITYGSDIYAGNLYVVELYPYGFEPIRCKSELLPELMIRLSKYSFVRISFSYIDDEEKHYWITLAYDFAKEKYENLEDLTNYAVYRLQEIYAIEHPALDMIFTKLLL